MKVHRDPPLQINKTDASAQAEKQKKPPASKAAKSVEDKVDISPDASELKRLKELAKLTPDVRLDKVNTIKKQIQNGKYDIAADSVAKSILKTGKELEPDDK